MVSGSPSGQGLGSERGCGVREGLWAVPSLHTSSVDGAFPPEGHPSPHSSSSLPLGHSPITPQHMKVPGG